MSGIEDLACEFRKALTPTVAKTLSWEAMPPESQQAYTAAAGSAVLFIISAMKDVVLAEICDFKEENAALRRALAERGLEPVALETGEFHLAEMPKDE